MAEALQKYMPGLAEQPTFGGSCYWVKGPEGLDARELKAQAAEHGILIESGDIHFLGSQKPLNYFRLGYSSINPKLIELGIEKLAQIMAQMLLEPQLEPQLEPEQEHQQQPANLS